MPRAPVYRDPSGNLKPWKTGPKQYKSGAPGVSGRQRLERRVRALLVAADRFAKKEDTSPDDEHWARGLSMVLKAVLGIQP